MRGPGGLGAAERGEQFLKKAIEGNLAEIEMGKLVQQKGNNDGRRRCMTGCRKCPAKKFDREFVKHMVDDHKKHIKEFQQEAKKGNAAPARFANDVLPDLQKHLDTAPSLQGQKSTTGSR